MKFLLVKRISDTGDMSDYLLNLEVVSGVEKMNLTNTCWVYLNLYRSTDAIEVTTPFEILRNRLVDL